MTSFRAVRSAGSSRRPAEGAPAVRPVATECGKPRQIRKEAAVAAHLRVPTVPLAAGGPPAAAPGFPRRVSPCGSRGKADGLRGLGKEVAPEDVRRDRRAGPRLPRPLQRHLLRQDPPRLPVFRHPRRREDHLRADPRPRAQLREGPHADARASSARPAKRSGRAAAPTSRRSTGRPTPASTTSAGCAKTPPTRRPASATRSTSSTKSTCCRRRPSTGC